MPPRPPSPLIRPSVADLSFEMLDLVISMCGHSNWADMQDLLSFALVSRQFYAVAKYHIGRQISIASTHRAQVILDKLALDAHAPDPFSRRVQHLSLIWPNTTQYGTRRVSILTRDQMLDLVNAMPAIQSLTVSMLPFLHFQDLELATLASTGALSNLRTLDLDNMASILRSFSMRSIAQMLALMPLLASLTLKNITLDIPETESLPPPPFSLRHLKLYLNQPHKLNPDTLQWILAPTAASNSLQTLVIRIRTDITQDQRSIKNPSPDKGFANLEKPFVPLCSSLTSLTLFGLRTGQVPALVSACSSQLRALHLGNEFGISPELLSLLPQPSSLTRLSFLRPPEGYRTPNDDHPISTPFEIPFSSQSFIDALTPSGPLSALQEVKVVEGCRFKKRGSWANNALKKVAKRRAVAVIEVQDPVHVEGESVVEMRARGALVPVPI